MVDLSFYVNKGPMTLQKVAELTGAELQDKAKADVMIHQIAVMDKAGSGDICFFYDKKSKAKAAQIKATACVTTEGLVSLIPDDVVKLISQDPKRAFLKLNMAMYDEKSRDFGIAASAKIAKTAKLGKNCIVGENVVIEDNVVIGDNCFIEHGAVITNDCKIGNNCRIGVNAKISYCEMGNDCYIFAGAQIGNDGFGFMMIDGKHQRIPQLGRVIIGDDVEIGANACVDRGALDDTVIGDGCRIDNLVQIAHNDIMGRGCVVVSQTGIAGSCTFGDYVVCGGQTGFADHLTIGSGAQIGAQSGLMSDVEPGAVLMGYPAQPIKDFMRQTLYLKKAIKK